MLMWKPSFVNLAFKIIVELVLAQTSCISRLLGRKRSGLPLSHHRVGEFIHTAGVK